MTIDLNKLAEELELAAARHRRDLLAATTKSDILALGLLEAAAEIAKAIAAADVWDPEA